MTDMPVPPLSAINVQTHYCVQENLAFSDKLAQYSVLFMHGAGKGQESEFITAVCSQLAAKGLECYTTDFGYMQTQKALNKKRPPDRMPKLLPFAQQWVDDYRAKHSSTNKRIILAGKSMGGRVATMLLSEPSGGDNPAVAGWFVLGFPFFAPTQKDFAKHQARVAHLKQVGHKGLIVQGTRDAFSKNAENIESYLSSNTDIHWLATGDHDFKPLKKTGLTQQDLIHQACKQVIQFVVNL